ncbi:hypothetical protein ACT29H_10870 [Thermophagus sp. OGC60D27]
MDQGPKVRWKNEFQRDKDIREKGSDRLNESIGAFPATQNQINDCISHSLNM